MNSAKLNNISDSSDWFREIEEVQDQIAAESGGHVKRVSEYVYLLALKLGLSRKEAAILRAASPMHDIGKAGIPESILNNTGALTPEEYEVMKWHTTIGHGQLKNRSDVIMEAAAIIAHEHHEKWDGTGYPRGLRGEEIHLYGRITSVADVFDALSSKRSYKNAWDADSILQYMNSQRGKHFDPEVLDAFMDILPEIRSLRQGK
jgi:response regulator RpfG family c-di-GMP phosphodiesterase